MPKKVERNCESRGWVFVKKRTDFVVIFQWENEGRFLYFPDAICGKKEILPFL